MGPAADPKGRRHHAAAAAGGGRGCPGGDGGADVAPRGTGATPRNAATPERESWLAAMPAVGWRDMDEEDRLGDESPEDERSAQPARHWFARLCQQHGVAACRREARPSPACILLSYRKMTTYHSE